MELRPMRTAVGQPQNVRSNRTLEARGITPFSATSEAWKPRRGLVFLGWILGRGTAWQCLVALPLGRPSCGQPTPAQLGRP